jgi:hypothetical protein
MNYYTVASVNTPNIGTAMAKLMDIVPTMSTPTGIATSRSNVFEPRTLATEVTLRPSSNSGKLLRNSA